MLTFDDAGLMFGSDKSQPRPLIYPEGARIIEAAIEDISQQNVREILYVLVRFLTIRKFSSPSIRQLCNGQPSLFAKQDRHAEGFTDDSRIKASNMKQLLRDCSISPYEQFPVFDASRRYISLYGAKYSLFRCIGNVAGNH
jgi:hypothetical protein